MVDREMLRDKMRDSGMTVTAIAEKTGMLRETLYNRLANGDFKVSEVHRMTAVLHLTKAERDAIFFADDLN